MYRLRTIVGLILMWVVLTPTAKAITLDWNSVSWTSESLTGYFELDASNPGADVSITISGQTGDFLPILPIDFNYLTGGQGSAEESLWLGVNHDQESDTVIVTVNFHYAQGVTGASFMLFDIDRDSDNTADVGYRDLISSIYGSYDNGAPKAASITGSSETTVSNNNTTNATVRGNDTVDDDDNDGNATFNYGTNIINSFTFTYGNHSSSPSNPGYQWIGLYDISFTARPRLPEAGTTAAVGAFCALAILIARRFRQVPTSP